MLAESSDMKPRNPQIEVPEVMHALQLTKSAVSPSVYAYTRQTTRRNLYRIQLPY